MDAGAARRDMGRGRAISSSVPGKAESWLRTFFHTMMTRGRFLYIDVHLIRQSNHLLSALVALAAASFTKSNAVSPCFITTSCMTTAFADAT